MESFLQNPIFLLGLSYLAGRLSPLWIAEFFGFGTRLKIPRNQRLTLKELLIIYGLETLFFYIIFNFFKGALVGFFTSYLDLSPWVVVAAGALVIFADLYGPVNLFYRGQGLGVCLGFLFFTAPEVFQAAIAFWIAGLIFIRNFRWADLFTISSLPFLFWYYNYSLPGLSLACLIVFLLLMPRYFPFLLVPGRYLQLTR